MSQSQAARAARRAILSFGLCVLAASSGADAWAQEPKDPKDSDVEDFEDEDPYTEHDPKLLERLGYVSLGGPFLFAPNELTTGVRETLGGIEVLWVETAHFKLGSTLGTYGVPQDQDERALVERDVAQLKKRLGRLKRPGKELDPWLRLHLYAQRLEALYADFCARFDLDAPQFPPGAPYLGQREKFLVLLCDQKSSLGRFLKRYVNVDQDYSYRWSFPSGGFFFGIAAQALREGSFELDAALYCAVVSGLVQNFVDAYRENSFGAPAWWRYGLAHGYARRVDPRFTPAIGYEGRAREEDDWLWEERVLNLVKNEFFASTETMFGWKEYGDLDVRDHMVVWSKVDYLLGLEEADHRAFLEALCRPAPQGTPAQAEAERKKRQVDALQTCFGLAPAALDEAWAKHVRRNYR